MDKFSKKYIVFYRFFMLKIIWKIGFCVKKIYFFDTDVLATLVTKIWAKTNYESFVFFKIIGADDISSTSSAIKNIKDQSM